jgi:2-polyprenyl-6-methoxyphenol hydroxylase-like FAD-dependent oxidoreductase
LPHDRLAEFKRDVEGSFVRFWASVPEGPEIRGAKRVAEFRGMLKQPNSWRPAAARGAAFVGDAALCVDPIWGTGCGWGFESAAWLVDATAGAVASGIPARLERALERYAAEHRRRTRLHALHIADFSRVRKNRWLEELLVSAAARDTSVARVLHAYLARRIGLGELLAPRWIGRSVWVNARRAWSEARPAWSEAGPALLLAKAADR